jgi:hypothetical protein
MKRVIIPLGIGILSIVFVALVGCGDEEGASAPQNVLLTAVDLGQSVLLSWEEPVDGQPGNYVIYFREIGTADWVESATIEGDTLEYIHEPMGVTGDYYVAARFGGTEYGSDTATTIPIYTDVLSLSELNASGDAGYGWALAIDYMGATYAITNAANDSFVDLYVTNFINDAAGGPWSFPWSIASPDTATQEPGGGAVPQADWRVTWFSDPLLDPQAILPRFAQTTFFRYMSGIEADTTYIGVYLDAEEHYGLVKFFDADTIAGTIQVETWLQTVPGLRLINH